jgi:hypothetical protein
MLYINIATPRNYDEVFAVHVESKRKMVCLSPNNGEIADIPQPPLGANNRRSVW